MIDRETVLKVATLARLEFTDGEIEQLSGELSKVLGHIEKIGELDLTDVEPTAHVVELAGGLRADEPQPSLPRELALDQAPDHDQQGFRVPSPGA